jgi:hypothetical protein
MPPALRMAAIVDRATRWPRFFSAPCMRVYPHLGFSVAIRTTRRRISASTTGRPGRRRECVHFRTINSRCHRRMVSGVTSVATSRNTARPRRCPSTARRQRCASFNRSRRPVNVLSVHDSPREETQSHHVGRARAIQTAPRAASVTDSRRESTRMCRPSFQTLRADIGRARVAHGSSRWRTVRVAMVGCR